MRDYRLNPPEPGPECPKCDGYLIVDKFNRTEECSECDYENGYDWDAEAEARLEAKEMDCDPYWGL